MNIAVLGTGMVGQTLAGALAAHGHKVVVGTRDPRITMLNREASPATGAPAFASWAQNHPDVSLQTYAEASEHASIIVNATSGSASIAALHAAGEANLRGKVLIDIANPLDFSQGFPPSLFVANTDSLGEQIQKAFPELRVVKTLNTINAELMVNPGALQAGEHTMFICGNDEKAKSLVHDLLSKDFGWKDIIDLGDISNARGTEMLLPIWVRLYGKFQSPHFGFKVVR